MLSPNMWALTEGAWLLQELRVCHTREQVPRAKLRALSSQRRRHFKTGLMTTEDDGTHHCATDCSACMSTWDLTEVTQLM